MSKELGIKVDFNYGKNFDELIKELTEVYYGKDNNTILNENTYDIISNGYKNGDSIIVDLDSLINLNTLYDVVFESDKEKFGKMHSNMMTTNDALYRFVARANAICVTEDIYKQNSYIKLCEYENLFKKVLPDIINNKLIESLVNAYLEGTRIYICSKYDLKHEERIIMLLGEMINNKYNIEFIYTYMSYEPNSPYSKKYIIDALKLSIKQSNKYTKTLIIIPESGKLLHVVTNKTNLKIMYL